MEFSWDQSLESVTFTAFLGSEKVLEWTLTADLSYDRRTEMWLIFMKYAYEEIDYKRETLPPLGKAGE